MVSKLYSSSNNIESRQNMNKKESSWPQSSPEDGRQKGSQCRGGQWGQLRVRAGQGRASAGGGLSR